MIEAPVRKPCSVCKGTGVPRMVSTDQSEVLNSCPECGARPRTMHLGRPKKGPAKSVEVLVRRRRA